MALTTSTQAEIALKNLLGKSQTASSATKGPNNEAETISLISNSTNIWTSSISTTPSTAVSDGVAEYVVADLTLDVTSSGQAFFATYPVGHSKAGQRVVNSIPPTYGTGYEAKPYASATLIPPGDSRDWIYQYQSGVFYQQTANASPTPTSIQLYVYKGQTLSDIFTGLTVNGAISGITFYGDGSNLTGLITTDTYITGGTYDKNTGIITLTNNYGVNLSITGISNTTISDVVLNDNILIKYENQNVTQYIINAVTGGTYDDGVINLHGSGTITPILNIPNYFLKNKTDQNKSNYIHVNQSIFNPMDLIILNSSIFIIENNSYYYTLGSVYNNGILENNGVLKINDVLYINGILINNGTIE